MDGAATFCPGRSGGGDCFYHRRPRRPGTRGICHRGTHLANEYRHYRERPLDRDRSGLRVTDRCRDDLLDQLVVNGTIALADLGGAVDLAWTWLVSKGSRPPFLFLCGCFR